MAVDPVSLCVRFLIRGSASRLPRLLMDSDNRLPRWDEYQRFPEYRTILGLSVGDDWCLNSGDSAVATFLVGGIVGFYSGDLANVFSSTFTTAKVCGAIPRIAHSFRQ
ncbi:hypothetical protein HPP92_020165 [Vanilla planifolia]|uniref:Uncharacterized protein n=1 Tax=Vanilla planifolia TaxID=51239 RepID=A0A835ULT3_VANPL|nr:hypothetical protein HPP92_020165 [Vanilla planifolia]